MARTLSAFTLVVRANMNPRKTRSRKRAALGPGFALRVVVVMVMAMMVMASRKYRAGEHHQKQGSCKNLFHGTNVAPTLSVSKRIQCPVSRDARGWEAVPDQNSRLAIKVWNYFEDGSWSVWAARVKASFNAGSKTGRKSGNAYAAI